MKHFLITKEKTKEMLSRFIKFIEDKGYTVNCYFGDKLEPIPGELLEDIINAYLDICVK